ncbi:telomere repeat-binding protein 1-like isoform X2 [Gastrolobium bilobum]|uniref:telomere repeat-binding protein 1-like isoform X2 n=1 Tax=Gastrolobium bilobum TaxID=150636 RepID=UPI002AB15103|nr:telomere repeat-binding protein 1-like isoform X2 [Gastrolobium bilobum]
MVLQKRLEYGFNGYQTPATPRATRSARRRAKFQRRVEDNRMCAFDLLATIAGNLLQEKGNPTISCDPSSEKDQLGFGKECQDANKPLKAELSDEGSCAKKCFSHPSSQTKNQNCCLKESPLFEIDGNSGIASIVSSSSCSERLAAEELVDSKSHKEMENVTTKVELDSSGYSQDSHLKLHGDTSNIKDELHKFEKVPVGNGTEMFSFEDPLDEKPPALISLGGTAKLFDDRILCSSLSKGCDNAPVVSRDNDENSYGCTHPSSKTKSFRPKTCIDAGRIRKILASKFQKVAQKSKVDTLSNRDGSWKQSYQSKNCSKRHSSQMNIPFKKRKLFNYSSVSKSNGFIRSGGMYYSPENDPGLSSLEACQHSALRCRGSHVKLRIKSFRVPELFIEIPETATIGSLKRTVMDAVTAVLGGGLHIGVVLQGKKVGDDNKTLLQTGISHDNQLDALGFTLEPNSSQSVLPELAAHSPHVPSADIPQALIRYPSSPAAIHQRIQGNSDMLPEHQLTSLGNIVESDHDSVPSPIKASVDKGMTDSKELVTVLEMGKEKLPVVPVLQKSKQSEIVQRRIRRPFSVDEVEALVQAVEKLGTGRWRDVKLCAFDNAKHRTYVDLKDKWKTLVHTARISSLQRRGEPVPQELLDRVLTAHSYWSQQQSKQHPETTLSFNKGLSAARGFVDGVGVLVSDFY